ncbi:MAG: hypothetical protein GY851_09930 [bacterium]|nr:hypothetical protein [bacterium]
MKSGYLLALACVVLAAMAGFASAAEDDGFTFVQMCDTQLGMGGYEHDVDTFKLAVKQINAQAPDFVVICGDLVNVPEPKSFEDFMAIRKGFAMPCHCVSGNHDVGNAPTPESLKQYRELVGKDQFAFEHKGYLFVVVNTGLWKTETPVESEKQDTWLKKTLEAAKAKDQPVIVCGHHPLFLKTADEAEEYFNIPPERRKAMLDLFAATGVRAVITGHTHRQVINEHNGILFVSSDTTSKNFDGEPMGYRVWHAAKDGTLKHEYTPVEGAVPPAAK